ncbi:MAG TPA: GNAT family N-acetyltransferase [Pyrinomonadaceae bacterium]|nr:GNAT family N-acetyltransferase [Pyrinomonadaceae bacterium]
MLTEIKQAESLSDAEQQKLFGWGEDIFGVQPLILHWRHKDVRFVLYENGAPVSHAGILKHSINVNGEPVSVAGLGGVVTVPEAQRKGLARQLVQHAMRFAESEWEVDAGLLFCRPPMVTYYEALGWQLVESQVIIEQPSGKIASPLHVMVLPFGKMTWPAGSIELQSLPW